MLNHRNRGRLSTYFGLPYVSVGITAPTHIGLGGNAMASMHRNHDKLTPRRWCQVLLVFAVGASVQALLMAGEPAAATSFVDVGKDLPSAKMIDEGLFPDDACEELKANGFKCMGFKPAVKFSLPASSFAVGSVELPEGLRLQLDRFAQVLKGKSGGTRIVRVEGHADASGNDKANERLSQRRAEAARDYLVSQGVASDLLKAVGVGARDLVDAAQPNSAKNRRVVIGREQQPVGSEAP